jgi:hypothetical protein
MNDTNSTLLPPMVGDYPRPGAMFPGQPAGANPMRATPLFFLMPFIEQDTGARAMAANHNDSWWCGILVKTYVSPSDPSAPGQGFPDAGSPRAGTSYAPNEWVFTPNVGYPTTLATFSNHTSLVKDTGAFAGIPRSIKDGTSNTILYAEKYMACGAAGNQVAMFYFGETGGDCNRLGNYGSNGSVPGFYTITTPPQASPNWQTGCDPCQLQAMTSAGILVGMCDGSGRTVSTSISAQTWAYAICPTDGQPLGGDW